MRDFKVRTKLSTIFTTLHLGQQQSVFPSIFHVANYALSHEEAGAVFRLERNRTDTVFEKSPKKSHYASSFSLINLNTKLLESYQDHL